jgi:Dienelactone hydrolase family
VRVDTGFVAHTADVTANLLQGVQGPLSIASAGDDAIQSQDRRFQSENILKQNGWPYKISLYSHLRHGFAVRRAVITKAEVYAKKQAFFQAVQWFEKHLVDGSKEEQ